MKRKYKFHYWGWAACAVAAHSHSALSSDPYRVTCLVCMYKLGMYVPLSKLREHQTNNMVKHDFQEEFFAWCVAEGV